MHTTTPCARASLPPSNANCWSGAASPHRSRHAWPASASSKASIIPPGGTRLWGIARPFATNRRCKHTDSPPAPEPSTEPGQLHQNGAKWRSIPAELGPWWLAAQLFIRWAKQGVWERLLDLIQQHDIALGMTFLDGTNIRAHHKAAGAQKRGSTARKIGRASCRERL